MGCCNSTEAPEGAANPKATQLNDIDVKDKPAEDGAATPTGGPKRRMTDTTRRRIAVRGETQEDLEEQYKPDKVEPKDDAAAERIKNFCKNSDLLAGLSDDQVQILVDAFFLVPCSADDPIIKEGEDGDHFYMVDSGKFEVTLKSVGTSPIKTYETGDTFGELALLYNSPRAATVKCTEAGALWALERAAFRFVVVGNNKSKESTATGFLKAVSILSPLTDDQRMQIADKMTEQTFSAGEYVVEEGAAADSLFFVKQGELVCTKMEGSSKKELMRVKEGGVFGESCLEANAEKVRKANVVAVGDATILKLTAADFTECLGNLGDVVSKNFKRKVMEAFNIDGTPIWLQLDTDEQEKLLDALVEKAFPANTEIITQDKANTTFYIIKSGQVSVVKKEGKSTPRTLAELGPGKFFGERALIKDEDASATIKACAEGCVLYTCDRPTFSECFGSLQKLLDAEVARRDEMAKRPAAPEWSDLEIRRILGVGTFGRVKLILQKSTQQTYALKCMRKAQVVQTKQQQHVMHEKKILSQMEHPFILALVATYQDAGELYMLLEVALGGELFSLLAKRAPLPDAHARFYSAQVVSIFSYMHGLKIVYRDLKPENLLIDPSGYIKMVDFGFAKVLNERTWTLCGTPEYLAPEIILNKGHGFGADWWCVGILTFECLTGATPFVSNDPMDGYRKIIKCRVPWPVSISSITRDFIDKLLVVEASKRLGCLRGGSLDVRSHPWFSGLDFKKLEAKKVPAPFVPKIKSHKDDSNFQYFEDDGIRNFPQSNFPRDMFSEFASVWVNE